MEAWQERVVQEKVELDVKLEKLNNFLNSPDPGISGEDFKLLLDQRHFMSRYSEVLGLRIARFGTE